MYTNILVLDDGTEIQAGAAGSAITSLVYTSTVSSTTDLCPGAACAGKIEFTVWVDPGSSLVFTSGTRVQYYQQDDAGARTLIGTFWAVKPTKQTRNTYKVYAYDAVSKLDGIQSTWLRSVQESFPMSLWAFAQAVAQQCGVTLESTELPRSADYQVQAFYSDNLTGRQLLSWVAEASCTFLRATPDGGIEFAWYIENPVTGIFPDATEHWVALDLSGQILTCSDGSIWTYNQDTAAYRSGGLSYEEYRTALIDKVQIKQSDDDVGVIYPPAAAGQNALVIQGNLLLITDSTAALQPVAQAIFETMQRISYTPLKASLFSDGRVFSAGQIITATDPRGNALQTYIMTVQQQGPKISVESTGNARRDGTAAVNSQKWQNLQGKMLEIEADVDGLSVKASELAGNYTELNLDVEGLSARTQNLEGDYTQLDLEVGGLSARTQNLEGDATQLRQTVDGLDLTVVKKGQVRTQFAADADSVDITSGLISFKSNTLAVDSNNFKLNAAGNVTASGSFSSNNGVGGAGRNESSMSSGSISFRRTTSAGKNLIAAEMYGLGDNASHGCMNIYGTDNSNNNNIAQFIVQGSFTGGQVWIRNAAGQNEITLFGGNGGNAGFEGNVDIKGETGLGVSKNISCQSINVWGGGKSRVVPTSFGPLKMAAFETPEPTFADTGSAVCDETGICCLALHPKLAETLSAAQQLKWLVTPTAPGSLWVEKQPNGAALIHGDPGQTFDWLCMGAQVGFDAQYAERTEYDPPNDHNPAYGQLDLLEVFEQETQQELDSLLQYPDYIYVEDELLKGELV